MKDAWWIRQLELHTAQARQQEGSVCGVDFMTAQQQAPALVLKPIPGPKQIQSQDPPLPGIIANSLGEVQGSALWHQLRSVRPRLEALGLSIDTSVTGRGLPSGTFTMPISRDMDNVQQSTRAAIFEKFELHGVTTYKPNEDGSCTDGVAVQIAALITNFDPPITIQTWLSEDSKPKGIYSNITYAVRAMTSIHAWLERFGTKDGITDEKTLNSFQRVIKSWEAQISQTPARRRYSLDYHDEMVPQDIATVFALQFNVRVTVVVADTTSCSRTAANVNATVSMYEVPNVAVFDNPNVDTLPLAPFAILSMMYRNENNTTVSHAALIYE